MISFFFFNDTATTEIYTLSLHDALPIWIRALAASETVAVLLPATLVFLGGRSQAPARGLLDAGAALALATDLRSEEHTSELQSQSNLVCRLLLEKKNTHRHLRLDLLQEI